MKIVIDIPDAIYERFGYEYSEQNLISKDINEAILDAFCNGTPLPKRQGRSGDLDALEKEMENDEDIYELFADQRIIRSMAEKVEVVIKIPKYYLTHPQDYSCLAECVRRGVPLPKGHGRIGDLDRLYNVFERNVVSANAFKDLFDNAPTIIEGETE